MIWIDLTEEVLRQRVVALAPLALGESYRLGWSPQEFIGALVCDACGATLDLADEDPLDLTGWSTTGTLRDGFQDRCPTCSSKPYRSPAPRAGG
jgi:hypothetical protein